MKTSQTILPPVLILSAHTIGLGVARALGIHGVPVYIVSYDKKDMAFKSKYIKKLYRLPHPEKETEEFIEGLLKIGDNLEKPIIIAADDPTLVILSKNKSILSSKFNIPSPDWNVIKKVINKDVTYSIAESLNIPIPRTAVLDNTISLSYLRDKLRFPCLLKPAQSHTYYEVYKSKMAVVNSFEELIKKTDECKRLGIDVTAQEIIIGDVTRGFNYNSLFYDGKILQGFAASKVRMTDEGYGIPVVVRSCELIPELENYATKLLNAIGYEGYSCIEFKFDEKDGLYKLLEVNGRYNRSLLLSVKAGLNFPWIEYNYMVNQTGWNQVNYKNNVYYIDEFKDIQTHVKKLLKGELDYGSFLKPYFSNHIFAVFSFTDPMPFIKRISDGFKLLTSS